MTEINKDINFLQETLPFWCALIEGEKRLLLAKISRKTFESGESIHQGGSDCTGLWVVKTGQLRTFILSESGKEITLFRLFERDVCILSSSCIMRNITFEVQVEAEKFSEAYLIPTSVYKRLSDSNAAVRDFAADMIASRLSDVMWVMEQVVFMSLDKRLANFLLEQCIIEDKDVLTITHENIAKNLGTAREVITRMLKYFQNEEMVLLSRGTIIIIDKRKLSALFDN
jgi:CRP/FNR family transcriptional regulator, anaerobic regulatory protein